MMWSTRWIVLGKATRPFLEKAEFFFSKEGAEQFIKRMREFYTKALALGGQARQADPSEAPTWAEATVHPLAAVVQDWGAVPLREELWIVQEDGQDQAAFSLVLLEDPEGRATYLLEEILEKS